MSIRNIIIVLVAILFSAVNASVFSANGSENNIIIKFKPLIVVDNYKVGSPVYGIIIEDVKQEGKTVIPTGTEIIGITTKGPDRDKIYFDNQWSFIYRTPENKAGVDIKFSGDAFSGNSYSEKGFKCYLIDNTDPKDLYAISNVFMHGLDNDNKVTNEVKKILTETQNKYVEQYAEKMQETIKREGYFLRLPPGTIIAVKTKNIDILTH